MNDIQSSPELVVASLYREFLGRDPDAEGLKHFADFLRNGGDTTDIINAITSSEEYRASHNMSAAKRWDAASAALGSSRSIGWLDCSIVLRLYVQPAITGKVDENWLVGLVKTNNVPLNLTWISLGCGAANQEIYASDCNLFDKMTAYDVSPVSVDLAKKTAGDKNVTNIDFKPCRHQLDVTTRA